MNIQYGEGRTQYGPGVSIRLPGEEVAWAVSAYLVAHNIHVVGPRTIKVNGELCREGHIYVDPSGHVVYNNGECMSGRGAERKDEEVSEIY